jgi:hypothetical protein
MKSLECKGLLVIVTIKCVGLDSRIMGGPIHESSLAAGPDEERTDKLENGVESARSSRQVQCRIWTSLAHSSMQ